MNSARPTFEVLLAAYNGMTHLDEQIASILAQKDVDVTLSVRVDPSTDETLTKAREWAGEDSRVARVVAAERPAGGAARNFYHLICDVELPESAGHVALADQDDIWYPHKLSRAAHMLAATSAGGYSSDVDAWDPDLRRSVPLVKSQPQRTWDHLFSSAGPGCTYVLSRPVFLEFQSWLQGLDQSERNAIDYHDWLIYAWAREKGYLWIIDNQRTMAYRQHSSNQIGANRGLSAARRRLAQVRDGWYFDQVRRTADVLGVGEGTPVDALRHLSASDRLRLVRAAPQARRRKVDQAALAAAAVLAPRRRS